MIEQHFQQAIAAAGLTPPDDVIGDGKIHRFSTNGKPRDESGWYALHLDGVAAGSFGDWRTGLSQDWCSKSPDTMTRSEQQAHRDRIKAMQAARDAEQAQRHRQASEAAASRWNKATPATEHPYLTTKGIKPNGIRTEGGNLLVPMRDTSGKLHSLQVIDAQGDKRFLLGGRVSGCYFGMGKPDGVLVVAEGFATGASIHESTGHAVAVAFNAGNLKAVAVALRAKHPAMKLIVAADDDHLTAGNPGLTKATEAAQAVGGWLAAPDFGADRPDKATDFNDLRQLRGTDLVAELVASAVQPAQPPAPEPPPPMLRAVSIADLFTHPSPDIAHVWGQLVPRGVVTMWGAHGGTGKSMMALMLCVAVAVGRDLFGQSTDRSPVLFVSLEDAAHVVRGRLSKICKAWQVNPVDLAGQLHIVDGTQNPELYEAEHRNGGQTTPTYSELAQLAQQVGAGLIVIDNASDAYGGDEINRRQVRAFIRTLAKIASDGMRGIVLLSHVDKGTSRNGAAQNGEGYSGSTAWNNSVRSRLFMARQSNGSILIEHQKSNLGPMQAPLTLVWPADGLPELANNSPDYSGLNDRAQGRADDTAAAGLLSLIAEFEGRGQYCSPAITSKNTPFSMLASEPAFKRMGLSKDDVRRIVNQCQRAGWLAPLDYRTPNRKDSQRWTLTDKGREFAGLIPQSAPTAPSCANYEDGASWSMAQSGTEDGAPTAPSCAGVIGVRERTEMAQQDGAQTASFSGADEGEI